MRIKEAVISMANPDQSCKFCLLLAAPILSGLIYSAFHMRVQDCHTTDV
jgi:hypothetical protein